MRRASARRTRISATTRAPRTAIAGPSRSPMDWCRDRIASAAHRIWDQERHPDRRQNRLRDRHRDRSRHQPQPPPRSMRARPPMIRCSRSRAHRRLGDVLPLLGDQATALTHVETSLGLYTARAARPGATADDRMQVCLGEMKMGDLLGNPQSANLGRPAEALRHFERAVACMRAVVASAPGDPRLRRNLAATLQRIGGMHEHAGQWTDAERMYTEVFAIVQALAADAAAKSSAPLPSQMQRDLAVGYGTLARVQRATGRLPEAVTNYREVLTRFERMVRDDPSDAAAVHGFVVNQELLGGT